MPPSTLHEPESMRSVDVSLTVGVTPSVDKGILCANSHYKLARPKSGAYLILWYALKMHVVMKMCSWNL